MNVNPQLLEAIVTCLWVKNRYGKSTICTLFNTGATAITYRNCINVGPENGSKCPHLWQIKNSATNAAEFFLASKNTKAGFL